MRSRLLVVFGVLAVAGALVGPGAAGDGSVLLYPQTEERAAAPGEEITVHVLVSYDGTAYGDGLGRISVSGAYNESLLDVRDVDTAGWFEPGDGEVTTDVETDPGFVNVSQKLRPAGEGVSTTARFVTLTFEVAPDAPATNTTVDLGNSTVAIAGGFPSPVFETNPEIRIDPSTSADRGEANPFRPSLPIAAVAVGIAAIVAVGVVQLRRRR